MCVCAFGVCVCVCYAGENHMVSLLSSLTTCRITPINRRVLEGRGEGGEAMFAIKKASFSLNVGFQNVFEKTSPEWICLKTQVNLHGHG